MAMYSNILLITLSLVAANYGSPASSDELGELLVEQLIGRISEEPSRSCPQTVAEVVSWVRSDAESIDRVSYDVTVKICSENCIRQSAPSEEPEQGQQSGCRTCERIVTVQKEPFEILDEADNGCDDDVSDDSESELRSSFEKFVKKYNKAYDNGKVKEERFRIFRDNLAVAERLQRREKGTARYGINEFSDLTDEEFRDSYTGYRPSSDHQPQQSVSIGQLPQQFDWREYGLVTAVQNQGPVCNACWAFAATGVLETQFARNHSKLLKFSEQELIDCDNVDNGCVGGNYRNAFDVIRSVLKGLVPSDKYEYRGLKQRCTVGQIKRVVTVKEVKAISPNYNDMANYVYNDGPIAVALNEQLLKYYECGVIRNECNRNMTHAVLIVGFGEQRVNDTVLPYWIVKNSWATNWGEKGYFRIIRGHNHCGIESDPYIAYVN